MAVSKAEITAEKQFSKQDFLRQVFISLASDADTPTDVLSAQFGEIEEYEEQVVGISAQVQVDFSCSIGYDREEEYLTLEKYRDDNGRERQRQVVKTRTVTDWSPYHTVETFEELGYALNRYGAGNLGNDVDINMICSRAVGSFFDASKCVDGELEVDNTVIGRAQSVAEYAAYLNLNIPGAKRNGENVQYNTELEAMMLFRIPAYRLRYSYGGNDFYAEGFAVGEPDYSFGEKPKSELSLDNTAKKLTKKIKYATVAFSLLSVAFLVAYGALTVVNQFISGCCLGVGLLFACVGIALFFVRNKKIRKIINSVKREKLLRLNEALRKYGLAPLNEQNNNLG